VVSTPKLIVVDAVASLDFPVLLWASGPYVPVTNAGLLNRESER
jgi:hypothetical protein